MNTCANCRFSRQATNESWCRCHRHAPLRGSEETLWPVVDPSDWCGEWGALLPPLHEGEPVLAYDPHDLPDFWSPPLPGQPGHVPSTGDPIPPFPGSAC